MLIMAGAYDKTVRLPERTLDEWRVHTVTVQRNGGRGSDSGAATIPQICRQRHDIDIGDEIAIIDEDNCIVIKPKSDVARVCDD